MDSPMPKISWGCKKKTKPIESDCDSDETYCNESPPGIKAAMATVASAASSNDILHRGFHLMKRTTKTNVVRTNSMDDKGWSSFEDSSSSRQDKLVSKSLPDRHLSWKDPIASCREIRSKRKPKHAFRENKKDIQLHKFVSWLSKTDIRLTSSLLAGGQPLTCDEAERMLRKAKQCLQHIEKLRGGPEEAVRDAKCVADKIIKRVVKKMQEIQENLDQHCSNNVEPSTDRSSLEKNLQMTNNFVPEAPILQKDLQDSQEFAMTQYDILDETPVKQAIRRQTPTQSQSPTQMTVKGFTLSQNSFKKTVSDRKQPRWDDDSERLMPSKKNKGLSTSQKKKTVRISLGSESDLQVNFNEPSLHTRDSVELRGLIESPKSPSLLESLGMAQMQNCLEFQSEKKNVTETRSEMQNSLTEIQEHSNTLVEIDNSMRMETETQNYLETLLFEGSSDMFIDSNFSSQTKISESAHSIEEDCDKVDEQFGMSEQSDVIVTSEEVAKAMNYGDREAGSKSSDSTKGTKEIIEKTVVPSKITGKTITIEASAESFSVVPEIIGEETRTNGKLPEILPENSSQDFIGDSQPAKFESLGKLGRKVKHSLKKKAEISQKNVNGNRTISWNETEEFSKEPAARQSVQKVRVTEQCEESVDALGSFAVAETKQNTLQKNSDLPKISSYDSTSSFLKPVATCEEKRNTHASSELLSKSRNQISIDETVVQGSDPELRVETEICCGTSQKLPEIVLPAVGKLDDEQWRLLEMYYETQKKMRELEISAKTSGQASAQTPKNVQGNNVSHESNVEKESSSLENILDENNSGSLSLSVDSVFSVTQTSPEIHESQATNLIGSDESEFWMSSPNFQDSMEICSSLISTEESSESDFTADVNRGQSFTQSLLEDSQEMMDTEPDMELVRESTITLTEQVRRERESNREISEESREDVSQSRSSSESTANLMGSLMDDGSLTQSMLEDSQEDNNAFSNVVEKPSQTDLTASPNDGQSLTQSMLEDSQEMTDTQLASIFFRPKVKETEEKIDESSTLSLSCIVKPTNFTGGVDDESFTHRKDSQEIPLKPKDIKISPLKSMGAIPKILPQRFVTKSPASGELPENSAFGALPVFASSKSVVLTPSLQTEVTFQDANAASQKWNRSELLHQELNNFAQKIVRESQSDFEKATLGSQTGSSQTFRALAKSQPQDLRPEDATVTESLVYQCEGTYREGNVSTPREHVFLRPHVPVKRGVKRPLESSPCETRKSSVGIWKSKAKSNFVYYMQSKAPVGSQVLRNVNKWPFKDFYRNRGKLSVKQQPVIARNPLKNPPGKKNSRSLQTGVKSSLQLQKVATNSSLQKVIGTERKSCNVVPVNRPNVEIVPSLTAIGVELRRMQPNKTTPSSNVETVGRNEMQGAGCSETASAAKLYEYFVGTPMGQNAARKSICEGKDCGGLNSRNPLNQAQSAIGSGNRSGCSILGYLKQVNEQKIILQQSQGLNSKIIQDKSKDMLQRPPRQNQIQVSQQFSSPVIHSQAQFESQKEVTMKLAKTASSTKSQNILTSEHEQFETFDSLILKMFDYKNVLKRRANESRNSITQSNQSQLKTNTSEAQKSPSFLSELLSPTNLDPARAAERDMILSLTHVRTRTPRDFAPRNEKIAEFFQKPFVWDNIPSELLRDLEDSSDEEVF